MIDKAPRLLALDVFRGLTIALMIIVNSPGYNNAYSWLEHSAWDGCTLADLVFPFFIVIVGVSSVFALTNLKKAGRETSELLLKIIKRLMYIFIIGVILNILPTHFDLSTVRILGVLQRIAICYFCSAILFLYFSIRIQIIICAAILISYSLLISQFSSNIISQVDSQFLTPAHMYRSTFDPEGILSTFPAVASAMLGSILGYILCSSRIKSQQLKLITIYGLIFLVLGFLWSSFFPINKNIWSSSYVLVTGGLAYLVFACLFFIVDLKAYTTWSKPLIIFGKNSMLVYVLHVFFLKIQAIIHLPNANNELISLRIYLTNLFFGQFAEKTASVCYAISYTLLWLLILICFNILKKRVQYRLSPKILT